MIIDMIFKTNSVVGTACFSSLLYQHLDIKGILPKSLTYIYLQELTSYTVLSVDNKVVFARNSSIFN